MKILWIKICQKEKGNDFIYTDRKYREGNKQMNKQNEQIHEDQNITEII